ncbi:MAG: hypothetical protein WAR21_05705 [Candidatus Acidiferrales bacterium]|jgi:hypothetical protein
MQLLLALFLQAQHMHEHVNDTASVTDVKSLFDHHLAGVTITVMGILLFLEYAKRVRYPFLTYLWPLPLIAFTTFVFIWSDPEEPWVHWILHGEWTQPVAEHKFMEMAGLSIGLIELFRRIGWLKNLAWRQLINALILAAGLILLFHHGNHVRIIHVEHFWMSAGILLIGVTKIVGDVQKEPGWVSRYVVPSLFVVVGLMLVFYRE